MSAESDKTMWEKWCQSNGWNSDDAKCSSTRRFFGLYWEEKLVPSDAQLMAEQIATLRDMVVRLTQEVTAMQRVLKGQNLLDQYEQEMLRTMAGDHGGAGADPWTRYSIQRLLVSEPEYLEETLQCTAEERQAFAENVEAQMRLT